MSSVWSEALCIGFLFSMYTISPLSGSNSGFAYPEVNTIVHLRWLFLVLIKKPKVLFINGSQNLFYQLYLRLKYNKSVSIWLDSFLDNYLLVHK